MGQVQEILSISGSLCAFCRKFPTRVYNRKNWNFCFCIYIGNFPAPPSDFPTYAGIVEKNTVRATQYFLHF